MSGSIKLTEEEKRSQIFREIVCHVPDEALHNCFDLQFCRDKPERIIMFIDVSGFTAMTEMFSKHSKAGIDELTHQLNRYFTAIVDYILAAGGDVFKFAGDAILSSWIGYDKSVKAVECALAIQQSCNRYVVKSPNISNNGDHQIELELNVRIVLSVGKSRYLHLTSEQLDHFIIIGEAIEQLKSIEKHSEISIVLLSHQFWSVLPMSTRLRFDPLITESTSEWIKVRRSRDAGIVDTHNTKQVSVVEEQQKERRHERHLTCRLSETQENLRKLFKLVIGPVFERIAHLEPLKYASEMTELSVCFVNAHIEEGTDLLRREAIISLMYNYVSSISQNYDGMLTKVIAFDKGLSFLCLFGLGSSDNPYVCALDSSLAIRSQLLEVDNCVADISIAVTSGVMYCGVVGHPQRHEYTTIGRKVNMAARFMCAYPNMVSCDEDTMLHSRLSKDSFVQLEYKKLKGMEDQIGAYQYGKRIQSKVDFMLDGEIDLSFDGEIGSFGRKLELLVVSSRLIQHMGMDVTHVRRTEHRSYVLIFRGEDGCGRSVLLRYIFRSLKAAPTDREVYLITCVPIRGATSTAPRYVGLTNILAELLKVKFVESDLEYRRILFQRLLVRSQDASMRVQQFLMDWFCLRNDTALQISPNDVSDPDDEIMVELIDLVLVYLQPKQFILLMDDLHYMDYQSLRLVERFSKPPQSIIIGTARSSPRLADLVALDDGQFIEIKSIANINELQMQALICKIFKVESIDKELLKVLYQRTRGLPMLCVEALLELSRSSLVTIKHVDEHNTQLAEKFPLERAPKQSALLSRKNLMIDLFFERNLKGQKFSTSGARHLYCLSGNPNNLDMPTTIESAFMREHNRLSALEKSLLANCSVLDVTFSKLYVFGICRGDLSTNAFNAAIRTLFESHMLMCAHNDQSGSPPQIKCYCPHNPTNLPFFCRMYRFWHESTRSIVYSSMTRETIRYRRLNAIKWLEEQLPKMRAAGRLFGAFLGIFVESIKLPVSYTTEMTTTRKSSFMNILGVMRIKSYEQLITLGQMHSKQNGDLQSEKHFTDDNAINALTQYKDTSAEQSDSTLKFSFEGIFNNHITEISVKCVKFANGVVQSTELPNTFEKWGRIDTAIRLDYYSFDICMLLDSLPLEEFVIPNFGNKLVDETIELRESKKQMDTGIFIPCKQQLTQILEELITHTSAVADYPRSLYYTLKLADLHVTASMALQAKALLANADDLLRRDVEVPSIMTSLFCLIKARFEQYITSNYQLAVYYYELSLKYTLKYDGGSIYDASMIRKNVLSMYMALFVFIGLYRVTTLRQDIPKEHQRAMLEMISINLMLISDQLPTYDVQTFLVLTEEYHRQYVEACAEFGFGSEVTSGVIERMLKYLSNTMENSKANSVEDTYTVMCACYGYVLLKVNRDLSTSLDITLYAYNMFADIIDLERMALILPYICILTVKFNSSQIIYQVLAKFGKALCATDTFKSDNKRSFLIATYQALRVDLLRSYRIDVPTSSTIDIEIVSGHLRALILEMDPSAQSACNFNNLFYCTAVLCREHVCRSDLRGGAELLRLTSKILDNHCYTMDVLDPLTQMSFLLFSECQLLLKVHLEEKYHSSDFIRADFINCLSFMGKHSVNYSLYCALKACTYEVSLLKAKSYAMSEMSKQWRLKALKSLQEIKSHREQERILNILSFYGL